MPATINPTTGDPCERVFAAFARPECELCGTTGMIPPVDDDGHDSASQWVPCPACEAIDEAAWWQAVDEAIQYHQDVGEWRADAPTDDWRGMDGAPPF